MTPPDGEGFKKAVQQAVAREKMWIEWKNKGCNDYVRAPAEQLITPAAPTGAKKRSATDDGKQVAKKVQMGNAELTRLWNLTATNMEGCIGDSDAVPGVEAFFEDAKMELDPAEDVGEEYVL
jgi:THO complex subunit 1